MLRRAARERREFVYRKTIEQRQKAIEERRERLKHALDGNKSYSNLCENFFIVVCWFWIILFLII
jgi:hypothetical protein